MRRFLSRTGMWFIALCLILPMILSSILPFQAAKAATETEAASPKREMRAAWISTVWNLDWPKKGANAAQQRADFITLLDKLKAMGMNAVVVQIRPMGDALYPTSYAPWSSVLTGTQGKSPGYDPLQFMIEEAHKRNLEFHAWFNPFRVSTGSTDITKLSENNPARQHPDWLVNYNGGLYYNPGLPEVRDFIQNTILEVVSKYDIDAVHLDDYFYPDITDEAAFHDEAAFTKYGSSFSSLGDWRRDNINTFVKDLSKGIKAVKSYVQFGISPNGIWQNISYGDGQSTTGMESYHRVYADSRKWVKENIIDYITPQVYWKIGHTAAPYEVMLQWWKDQVKGTNVHLYMGQAVYKLGMKTALEDWTNAANEIPNQIALNRSMGASGSMLFRTQSLVSNTLGIQTALQNNLYKYSALIPAMTHKDSTPPGKPTVSLKRTDAGVTLSWNQVSDAAYYAIYRFKKGEEQNINDATKLLATVNKSLGESYVDRTAVKSQEYVYAVTAIDRLHNEGKPAAVNTSTLPIRSSLDTPANGANVIFEQKIKGWVLAEEGIDRVEILIDGAYQGKASYGLTRSDVFAAYPQYNNQKSGYEYTLDASKLSAGAHKLTVRYVSKSGTTQQSDAKIYVNPSPLIQAVIDEPVAGAELRDTVKVRGWSLASTGVKKVEVLVDGTVQGAATYGLSRNDVYKALPQYKTTKAGYEYSLNPQLLSEGAHTLAIRTTANDGKQHTVQKTVSVARSLPLQMCVDTPVSGAQLTSTSLYTVKGWALAGSGMSKVEVFVDGALQGAATLGGARADVYRVFSKYNNKNSGFTYQLNTQKLSKGKHQLKVVATAKNGDKREMQIPFEVIDLPTYITLDEPVANGTVGQIQTVRGWALADEGIAKVKVLVDGAVKGEAQYGLSRLDVAKALPLYNNSKSGFTYSLNTAGLTKGYHTITIQAIRTDGKTESISSKILVSPLHGKTIVIDPGHGLLDSGAIGGGYMEKTINLSVGLKLRDLLKSYGVNVVMTRSTDTFLELSERAKISNAANADAFVSIHVNSATAASANGIETYYYTQPTPQHPAAVTLKESSKLAALVQAELLADTKAVNRGTRGANFAVLRENKRPSILVELGFISNSLERARLVSPTYQQTEAKAIFDGLYRYFE